MQVLILQGQKHEVTYLCPSPDGIHIAVGYEDGAVRIFSLLNGESNVSFNGHKSAVSVIHYDGLGARLVTGSRVHSLDHCAILFTQFPILVSLIFLCILLMVCLCFYLLPYLYRTQM